MGRGVCSGVGVGFLLDTFSLLHAHLFSREHLETATVGFHLHNLSLSGYNCGVTIAGGSLQPKCPFRTKSHCTGSSATEQIVFTLGCNEQCILEHSLLSTSLPNPECVLLEAHTNLIRSEPPCCPHGDFGPAQHIPACLTLQAFTSTVDTVLDASDPCSLCPSASLAQAVHAGSYRGCPGLSLPRDNWLLPKTLHAKCRGESMSPGTARVPPSCHIPNPSTTLSPRQGTLECQGQW